MPYVNKMYVTQIEKDFEGDTFFPKINEDTWNITEKVTGNNEENNNLKYEFITYERIKNNNKD
jgi:dihydrofolate reductase